MAYTSIADRSIDEIAFEIKRLWKAPYFGAVPYLDAMTTLGNLGDVYGCDDARDIILRFLGNATRWKGEDAKRIKAELKALLKG